MTLIADELEQKAEQTLRDAEASQVPVPIEKVARHLNLTIEAVHLEDIAGVLVVMGNSGAIGYNSAHSVMRRRFTVAHEISHFILHARKGGKPQVFADKRVMFRLPGDDVASPAYRRDVEANLFASALLMPRSAVLKEIEFYSLDLDEEKDMKLLANRFRVSIHTMARRLRSLRLILF
jgi:Zn-dependent peptidase ImmA (M78 family)